MELLSAKNLTYFKVHLYFTIPQTFVLYLLSRPFLEIRNWVAILSTTLIALIYTTPWDNYLIWTKTWNYPPEAVYGTIGLVPLEEYFFFIIQALLVSFFAFLAMRWRLPHLNLKKISSCGINNFIHKWAPFVVLNGIAIVSASKISPQEMETPSFYMNCILAWSLPIVGFLWIGAFTFILNQYKIVLFTILIPTFYLWAVDLIALRAGVWSINPKSILGIHLFDKLPLEEALFFLIVNVIIVFSFCAFEKSFTVLEMNGNFKGNLKNISFLQLLRAFFSDFDEEDRIMELELAIKVLKKASKSFWVSSFIFPTGMRHDLSIIYAFCRVTDDIADDLNLSIEEKQKKLEIIKLFIDQLFSNREPWKTNDNSWKYGLRLKNSNDESTISSKINWNYFSDNLSPNELSVLKCLSRISPTLPPVPFYELLAGYEMDISKKAITNEDDLVIYSECVASSVGVLCTFVLFNNGSGILVEEEIKDVMELGRKMGVALQLINISRDIVTDSEQLGRCYIPTDYFDKDETLKKLENGDPWSIPESQLRSYALKILNLAKKYQSEGELGIKYLPIRAQAPIKSAIQIYSAIGSEIERKNGYERRVSVSSWRKIIILLKNLYFY